MKKVLIKIYLVFLFLCIISLIILSLLGSKTRVGYLEISSFNKNDSYSNNYVYNFRMRYYDKVFRNSDIYGVYLNTNSFPKYIEVKMNDEFGTPFGILISSKEIKENKIDNVKYILKVKSKISNYTIIFLIFIAILLISNIEKIYLRYINFFNRRYFYIIVIFLCFLILPRIIYICFYEYFDHENYENRNFTKYPDINSNFFNYPKVYEPYFNDYLPFRNELVQLNGIIDYYIFRDVNYTSLTFYGKEYNQFWKYEIKNYAGEIHVTDLELEQMKNNLINFRDELSKNNIDVIFMICPNKSSVYNEYVPYYVNKVRVNSTDIIMQYITNNTDINIFYAKDELIKYKDKYQLYYKYDSHWNNLGGYVGFMNLIKKLNGSYNVIDIDNTTITEYTNIRYIDRNKYLEKPDTYFYISNFTTNEFHFLSSNGGGYGLYAYTESDSENNEEVLFLRDSFGYYMFDYMASYFKRLTFLHIYNFNYKHLIDKKPSIIVYEVAEHDLKNVFLNLIPKYEIEKINTLEN